MPTVCNRAIVQYKGTQQGEGRWTCTKDPSTFGCYHINQARLFAEQHLGLGTTSQVGETSHTLGKPSLNVTMTASHCYTTVPYTRTLQQTQPISYLPRAIPVWASLTGEERRLHRVSVNTTITDIPLDSSASCVCTSRSTTYNPFLDTTPIPCTIYGFTTARNGTVTTQSCQSCKRRAIGPDCQKLGIFNWNNRVLVSEDLLDDYTASFISSETPFVAFKSVVDHQYQMHQSSIPFLPEKTFREVWFGYILLMDLSL